MCMLTTEKKLTTAKLLKQLIGRSLERKMAASRISARQCQCHCLFWVSKAVYTLKVISWS